MRKRFLAIMAVTMAATMIAAQPVAAANWVQDAAGWWWQEDDGSYPVNKWKEINGQWYWFDSAGYMVKGWKQINGAWYCFDGDGTMIKGWKQIGGAWYCFDGDGTMIKGWKQIGGAWYCFDGDGTMITGWKKIGEAWYWFDMDGVMATDKWVGNYYVQADGTMATDKWIGDYYVDNSGLWTDTKEQHNWGNYTWYEVKHGYACNWCFKDITDYDDYYACHMSFHTHTFYKFPSYYSCSDCSKLLHRHNWSYTKPQFYENSDEISGGGYWICWGCGHQSSDGKNVNPVPVSDEGYEYGSINQWITPFNFEKDSNDWIVEDEQWEAADNNLYLDHIRIDGISSMAVGDTYQDTVLFTPTNPVEGKNVVWESSDPTVVSVDSTGKVTALKIGTATIKATSSGRTDTSFIRVTENNVGHVKSAKLLINDQSNTEGALEIKRGRYIVKVQTDPEQAVYEVKYRIEQNDTNGLIADIVGRNSCGNIALLEWIDGILYTDSATEMSFWKSGTVVVKATITDMNGDQVQLSQEVVIK